MEDLGRARYIGNVTLFNEHVSNVHWLTIYKLVTLFHDNFDVNNVQFTTDIKPIMKCVIPFFGILFVEKVKLFNDNKRNS